MKKLILIGAISLNFLGCSSESNDTTSDCNCGEITQAQHITLPSGEHVTTLHVKNNCSGQTSTIGLNGTVGNVGEQYCGN